jgi:hypothetical protein
VLCAVQGRYVYEATKHIPIIGDGDTGYGNAMNVKRTVKGYADAGFAGEGAAALGHSTDISISGQWGVHLGLCLLYLLDK